MDVATRALRGSISKRARAQLHAGESSSSKRWRHSAKGGVPAFVETLDAVEVGKKAGMPITPDHDLWRRRQPRRHRGRHRLPIKAEGIEERRRALAAVAGISPIGLKAKPQRQQNFAAKAIVAYPEDIGVRRLQATRSLLAARSMEDLVAWSGGLYQPPASSGAGDGQTILLPNLKDKSRCSKPSCPRAYCGLAWQALVAEAELTPKPGLVDRRGPGSHTDLSLDLMRRSARTIAPYFADMGACGAICADGPGVASEVAAIGRASRSGDAAVTTGSNAHKGAIWVLGLLVTGSKNRGSESGGYRCGRRRSGSSARPCSTAACIARRTGTSRYGATGARGEAVASFPHVIGVGLPALRAARKNGCTKRIAD